MKLDWIKIAKVTGTAAIGAMGLMSAQTLSPTVKQATAPQVITVECPKFEVVLPKR